MPVGFNDKLVREINQRFYQHWTKSSGRIKLVILDIDGVMTDGTKVYDENHNVISKNYCDRDFTAIKRLKAAGVNVCFLSGDKRINEGMAKSRGVDFFYSRDKVNTLNDILTKYGVVADDCAYIGDDIYYIPVLTIVQFSLCPSNSPDDVKNYCRHILSSKSGDSVVAEFYDFAIKINSIEKSFLGMV